MNAELTKDDLVTRCGYNFLDIEKHKCVSRSHFYPIKNTKRAFFENAFMAPGRLWISLPETTVTQ
jgi:hypothetical protein